jgi:alpha-L-fucosidase
MLSCSLTAAFAEPSNTVVGVQQPASVKPAVNADGGKTAAVLPGYLKGYEAEWNKDPRAANLAWFREARFGMFVHFSPASQVGEEGWFAANPTWGKLQWEIGRMQGETLRKYLLDKFEPQLMDPKAQSLIDAFTGRAFDAEKIADLAVAAGMKYITFTSQHVLGRMFMFETETSSLCSTKLAPKRDFVAELAKACERHNLALFLYVMPPYPYPGIQDRVRKMLTELLTNYGPIAGIWFDGIMEAYLRPGNWNGEAVSETYALVRTLQPHCLISFKRGYTGEEDFLAPEWQQTTKETWKTVNFTLRLKAGEEKYRQVKGDLWLDKPIEVCTTMLHGDQWFHMENGRHKTVDEVLEQYRLARQRQWNLLLNVAPRGDGSIHPEDERVLREVGRHLRHDSR